LKVDNVCFVLCRRQGENINTALRESDIEVRVADNVCNITSLSSSQITCLPAALQRLSGSPPAISSVLVYNPYCTVLYSELLTPL